MMGKEGQREGQGGAEQEAEVQQSQTPPPERGTFHFSSESAVSRLQATGLNKTHLAACSDEARSDKATLEP